MDSESTGDSMPDAPDWRRTSVVAGARLDLLEALEHLGGEVAESVALRDVMGLSYREIAELQRIPEGTVKSRIHDARKRLRHLLRPADDA
jgi:RNA polymerase sigma-70 factor (ECF subfamily)